MILKTPKSTALTLAAVILGFSNLSDTYSQILGTTSTRDIFIGKTPRGGRKWSTMNL